MVLLQSWLLLKALPVISSWGQDPALIHAVDRLLGLVLALLSQIIFDTPLVCEFNLVWVVGVHLRVDDVIVVILLVHLELSKRSLLLSTH